MTDCEKISKLLWDYPDLPDPEREMVSSHLSVCARCREAMETIKSIGQSRRADREAIAKVDAEAFDNAVMRKIKRQKTSQPKEAANRIYVMQLAAIGIAAAIVIFMIMSISDLGNLPAIRKEMTPLAGGSADSFRRIELQFKPSEAPAGAMAMKKRAQPETEEFQAPFSILKEPVSSPAPDSVNIDAVYLSDESVPTLSQQTRASVSEIVADTGIIQAAKIPSGTLVTVERMPMPVNLVTPEYPVWARKRALSGVVWIKARIDDNGKVTDAFAISSSMPGSSFEDSAVEAALKSTYLPAESNGIRLPVWIVYPVKFIYKK